MAGKKTEVSTPLLENILNQGEALRAAGAYQFSTGNKSLSDAARLLESKKRVILTGMGASYFACLSLEYALADLGLHVATCETAELLYFERTIIDDETVVVLVSRSGESVEAIKLLPPLRARGAAIVGVVNVPHSSLDAAADVTIMVGSPADQMVAVQTYTSTVGVFALLAAILAGQESAARNELELAIRIVSRWIPECISESREWGDFLERDWPLYLLGRGRALGSVLEGVLLMHETAKMPAVGMSVAQFRHGPVEVVDERFGAIIFGTQPETEDLDAALARDLRKMRGQVRWIGPAQPGSQLEMLVPWPASVPRRFLQVIEVIPLQVAAYRLAELRDVRPGEFRWAPLVTSTESGFSIPENR